MKIAVSKSKGVKLTNNIQDTKKDLFIADIDGIDGRSEISPRSSPLLSYYQLS